MDEPQRTVADPSEATVNGAPAATTLDALAWEALLAQGEALERRSESTAARDAYELAVWRIREAPSPGRASSVMRWIARTWQLEANYEAALDCLTAAEAIAEAGGDTVSRGHALNMRGVVHWQRGELDIAQELYRRALDVARAASDARLAATTAQNLGVVANVRGDYDAALRYYDASLSSYRSLGLARDICIVLNNLGRLHTERSDWPAAERAFQEALHIAAALGEIATWSMIELNAADMWVRRGSFDLASEGCRRAVSLDRGSDTAVLGEAEKILGVIARERGDLSQAEKHFTRAMELARTREDVLLQAQVAKETAELYRQQDRNRELLSSLNSAHRLFSQLRAKHAVADVDQLTRRLESEFLAVVLRWGESIEAKDQYTQGHCERVADLACALARRAGVESRAMFWFRVGALLHDVGKLVIVPEILNKPGKLTSDEWSLMREHTLAGVSMLQDVDFPHDVLPMVRSHHENWDGTGYPDGLAASQIPLWARIVCIADVYDALTSERSYKRGLPHEEALEVMRRDVGRQFDPDLFDLFDEITREAPPPPRTAPRPERPATTAPREAEARDELTGLLLRRSFLSALERALESATPERPTSLLVLDVDHFKLVNDTFGHLQGDDVLRAVADSIRSVVRTGDIVGRYAGDEFVVLLPSTTTDEAMELARRLCREVEGRRLAMRERREGTIGVTLSIGVAIGPSGSRPVRGALCRGGPKRCYEAKRAGRNGACAARDLDRDARAPSLNFERFVGRVRELRRLIEGLERSVAGSPCVMALAGEAGIGKTTLLRQLRPEVRLRGGALLMGRCVEADVKPPYGAWAEVVEQVDALGAVPPREWRELPRLVPAMSKGQTVPEASGSRYALLAELAEYLRLASAFVPLTIVLDDMQWADGSTWDALEYVLHQLEHERMMICLTIRAEDSGPITDRRRRLARDERFSEVVVQRLSEADVRQWIEVIFHQGDGDQDFPRFLHRYTEGNPLLVVHVLRSLQEDGGIWFTGKRWEWKPNPELRLPTAITDLIARRLDKVSETARQQLALAAVIGRSFDVDTWLVASGESEDVLLDAVDEALKANVIEAVGTSDSEQFTFTHGLIADAVQRSVNTRRLRRMHERVAEAFVARRPNALAEIAAHYDAAGVHEAAFTYALSAAEQAVAVYAHDEAAASFLVAQRHAPSVAEANRARFRHAQSLELAGKYEEAEAICDVITADAVASGEPGSMLPVRRLRERLRILRGQPLESTRDACEALLREARSNGELAEEVALLNMLCHTHFLMGDAQTARTLARASVEAAERLDDRRPLADSLMRLASTLLDGDTSEARECYARALRTVEALGDFIAQARCRVNLGIALAKLGDAEGAMREYRSALELARRTHAPDIAGLAALNLGVLQLNVGRYEEADACFSEAMRRFRLVHNEPHRLAATYNLAKLAHERQDYERARELYMDVSSLAGTIGRRDLEIGARAGQGLVGLAIGRVDEAKACLRTAQALSTERGDWWFQGRDALAALQVRVALRDGEHDVAERVFAQELQLADRNNWFSAAWLVAEVAAPFASAGLRIAEPHVAAFAARLSEGDFAPLAARYHALLERDTAT
ncbi:MAG: tetratricopeptide repeat protein [Gemmatimonadaceae bacterium]